MDDIIDELRQIKETLAALVERERPREYYEVEQFAQLVGKAPFTVREYCRLHRLHAEKRRSGRGNSTTWVISHDEYRRYQREGLLPVKPR